MAVAPTGITLLPTYMGALALIAVNPDFEIEASAGSFLQLCLLSHLIIFLCTSLFTFPTINQRGGDLTLTARSHATDRNLLTNFASSKGSDDLCGPVRPTLPAAI